MMRASLPLLALLPAALAIGDDDAPASTAEGVARINAAGLGWTAHVPPAPLSSVTNRELRTMCGSPLPRIYGDGELPPWINVMSDEEVDAVGIPPPSFDGRTAWPHCAPIIGHVRNQGPCGDCWAFGGTQMMQDRFCIATGNNASSQLLSVEDVIACMDLLIGTPGQGCGGGAPMNTFYYLSHEGIVSGGDYGDTTGDTCLPYLVPPTLSMADTVPTPLCVGQNKTSNHPVCVKNYKTPNASCSAACAYAADKRVAAATFSCPGGAAGIKCIQAGLMTGSGAASMVVFGDVWSYKSGLYSCGNRTGGSGHAVVLVGWGTDANGTDYWTVKSEPLLPLYPSAPGIHLPTYLPATDHDAALTVDRVRILCTSDSWGPAWGMKGFFNIKRGINECGIESSVMFAHPTTLGGKPVPKIPPPPAVAAAAVAAAAAGEGGTFAGARSTKMVIKTDDSGGVEAPPPPNPLHANVSCIVQKDVDHKYNDIRQLAVKPLDTAACCAACKKEPLCGMWVVGDPPTKCWLKENYGKVGTQWVRAPGMLSMCTAPTSAGKCPDTLPPPPPPPPPPVLVGPYICSGGQCVNGTGKVSYLDPHCYGQCAL